MIGSVALFWPPQNAHPRRTPGREWGKRMHAMHACGSGPQPLASPS